MPSGAVLQSGEQKEFQVFIDDSGSRLVSSACRDSQLNTLSSGYGRKESYSYEISLKVTVGDEISRRLRRRARACVHRCATALFAMNAIHQAAAEIDYATIPFCRRRHGGTRRV